MERVVVKYSEAFKLHAPPLTLPVQSIRHSNEVAAVGQGPPSQ